MTVAPAPQYLPAAATQLPEHVEVVNPLVLPNWPAGQSMHAVELVPSLYCPTGQTVPFTVVAVIPQYRPTTATHTPEQSADISPVVDPYRPIGHGVHDEELATLYWPAVHCGGVDLPGTEQLRPARQSEQAELPDTLQYRPIGHGLHLDPSMLYWPTGHKADVLIEPTVQLDPDGHGSHCPTLPNTEYRPAGHNTGADVVAPTGQYFPAEGVRQSPLQFDVVIPVSEP